MQSCEDILAFSRKNNGKYDLEAHTFYLRALLLLFFNLYASKKIPNEILQQFKCRLRKEKKYIIRNPYLESRKKLVFYLIILNFPSKILYKLWKNHTKG